MRAEEITVSMIEEGVLHLSKTLSDKYGTKVAVTLTAAADYVMWSVEVKEPNQSGTHHTFDRAVELATADLPDAKQQATKLRAEARALEAKANRLDPNGS